MTNLIQMNLKNILSVFVFMLANIKKGTAAQQVSAVISLGFVTTFFGMLISFFNNYVFPDAVFGSTLVTLIILDTVFGAAKYIKEDKFDAWEMLKGFSFKLLIGLGASMFAKTLLRIPEIIASEWATATITYFLKTSIVIWIGMSFLGSVYLLTNKKFPPSFMMERLNKYSNSGDVDDLITKESSTISKEVKENNDDLLNEAL